jgi:murein DD-endopeptidase MepM/ murein hydrolase activator NlpD
MKVPFTGCVLKEYPAGHITQYFGENPSLYARMSLKGHNGIDLVSTHGTAMCAVENGKVLEVKNDPNGYGKHLRFISTKRYDGLYREWTYGHCDNIFVKVGDSVAEGGLIATMGNTGFVVSDNTGNGFWSFNPFKGTHLHLGLRMVEKSPHGWSYPGSKIKIKVPNYENGYKGAIDPLLAFDIKADPRIENLKTQISLLTKVSELLKLKKALS